MKKGFAIVCSCALTYESFAPILEKLGGRIDFSLPQTRVIISDGSRHVWVYLEVSVDVVQERFLDLRERYPAIDEMLVDIPKSWITVDISSQPGSLDLALEFIRLFIVGSDCVIDNNMNSVLEPGKLLALDDPDAFFTWQFGM